MSKVDERRQAMLEYIADKKTVSTSELKEHFNIKKPTLSEDLAALKMQNAPIVTSYGCVSICESNTDIGHYDKIEYSTIRHWLILFIMSRENKPMTFEKIYNHYYKNYNLSLISPEEPESYTNKFKNSTKIKGNKNYRPGSDTLHKDLQTLQDSGYIIYAQKIHSYKLTNKYNHYIFPDYDALSNFCEQYSLFKEANSNDTELALFHKTAVKMLNGFEDDEDSYTPNENYYVHGKRITLDEPTKLGYAKLNEYPYETNVLNITYSTNNDGDISVDFRTGLVVYIVEKNRMYLLGETSTGNCIIPVDSVIDCKTLEETHSLYHSKHYEIIAEEMFSLSMDEPIEVKVRFNNLSYIRDRVNKLKEQRKLSSIYETDDEKYFIYTDKIRGLSDFASYIRSFSHNAFVLEPTELRDEMIKSANNIIDNYKGII